MTTYDLTTAEKLEVLVQQRKSHQISQWRFEQSKSKLLGEPLSARSNYWRDVILASVIGIIFLLGLALAYPKQTDFAVTTIWEIVKFDNRNTLEKYQDFKKSADKTADHMFAPVNKLLER